MEKEIRREKEDTSVEDLGEDSLSKTEATSLVDWLKGTLGDKAHKVQITKRLSSHPCLVSVEEMAAARHFVRTSLQSIPEDQRYKLLEPTLQINPSHPIMKKLSLLKDNNPQLAELLAKQVFDNAMVTAGLVDDPRRVTGNLNELITKLLESH
ncbi:heat shock protein 75 kDa, mitochondrial-like [Limulus polyphemus]|uniref:Heat shock protein 75 kDa, mitochondrial-like n=1 Tax=Limulus polyphemus TaxID=6850 RepID=A0ABM1BVR4_LIMPO|nr:heat shock protein 75 kDa, mitochondrial-like [Limulus polyphemus]